MLIACSFIAHLNYQLLACGHKNGDVLIVSKTRRKLSVIVQHHFYSCNKVLIKYRSISTTFSQEKIVENGYLAVHKKENLKMVRMIALVGSVVLFVQLAESSHLRSGIMSWKPFDSDSTEIEVSYRMSWRRSFSDATMCNQSRIQDKTQFPMPSGPVLCFSGMGCSNTQISPALMICTDFSASEDWSTGAYTFNHTFGSRGVFIVGFNGGAWIGGLVKGGGSWDIRSTVDTRARNDTGRINTSPVTGMPAIVVAQHNCSSIIIIPVSDADGDVLRCRWGDGAKDECGGVCDGFPAATLDQITCQLTVPSHAELGLHAVALMIEDFAKADKSFSIPLSAIPLEFIVHVKNLTTPCNLRAEYLPPTPMDKSTIHILVGTSYAGSIVARLIINNVPHNQTGLKTSSPLGLVSSVPALLDGSTDKWVVNVTWTPTGTQLGPHIFCFQAEFGSVTAERRCITFIVTSQLPTTTAAPTTTSTATPTTAPTDIPVTDPPIKDEPSDCECKCNCKPGIKMYHP